MKLFFVIAVIITALFISNFKTCTLLHVYIVAWFAAAPEKCFKDVCGGGGDEHN